MSKIIFNKLFLLRNEIGVIAKEADNPFYKSKYADYPSIMEVILPLLKKHNLLWLQPVLASTIPGSMLLRNCIIDVDSGEEIHYDSLIPMGNTTTPQAFGSSVTYGRRYTLSSLLNLIVDEDDDGNLGSQAPKPKAVSKISDAQRKRLFAVAKEANWTEEHIKNALLTKGVRSTNDLNIDLYEAFVNHMEKNPK